MLSDPRAPLIFGALMIVLCAGYLAMYYPMPAELSSAHSRIEGISGLQECVSCHHERGLAEGCLGCHEEIRGQLAAKAGYHHYLLDGKEVECASCHTEHFGRDFQLVNAISWSGLAPELFQHPHVAFRLDGKHGGLACEECHVPSAAPRLSRFPEIPREKSYLGLDQMCVSCHEDIHAGGLSDACDTCHGQDAFRPTPHFDHSEHFPLDGGHSRTECEGCHLIPAATSEGVARVLPFDRVRGTQCAECHESPHRTRFVETCDVCHPRAAPLWETGRKHMTPDVHARTGFRLVPPHTGVHCEECHQPGLRYEERYPLPSAPGYARTEDTCEGCHRDVHRSQFAEKYPHCRDCHHRTHFLPHNFGQQRHEDVYPLLGSHLAVPCTSCHDAHIEEARQFVGTPGDCKACHENPHGSQFDRDLDEGDCSSCHEMAAVTFAIRPFDHQGRTGYALTGAHAGARCVDCHLFEGARPGATLASAPRIYRGTPTTCASCHKDPHRGQFRSDGETLCDNCHTSTSSWDEYRFDHNTQSRFKLDGTHEKVPCSGCHFPVKLSDGTEFTQYKPLRMECKDCHEIIPD